MRADIFVFFLIFHSYYFSVKFNFSSEFFIEEFYEIEVVIFQIFVSC